MTVPSGTGGSPGVGTVSPASIKSGSATLSGTTITYAFNPVSVPAGTMLSIQITGLANTLFAGVYNSTITTVDVSAAVDTGTASFAFTSTSLGGATWTPSSTAVGAPNTTYTYAFTPSSLLSAVSLTITISVPPGTGGSPTIGAVSPLGLLGALNVPTLNASGTTLTITGTAVTLALGTPVSIQINGLTNTYTAGTYIPEITTSLLGLLADSAVTTAQTFVGGLFIAAPSSVVWNGGLNGRNQTIAAGNTAAEQLLVDDQTDNGAGWNVTVAASSFTNSGGYSLPGARVLQVNGSVTSATANAAPTAACLGSSFCTLPTNAVTYPEWITAATSPTPVMVYQAGAGSGIGPLTIGSTTANPFGWWLNVPGYAEAGTYSAAITVSIASGP
jgi:hypothetical protein